MNVFKSELRFQIPALQDSQLGMCKEISFSESKLLSYLWKSGPLHRAQHPEKPHQRHPKPFFTFKDFVQLTGTGQA